MNKNNLKDGLTVIGDLLLQPYAVDAGSIEYLIEESTRFIETGPVRVACSLLSRQNLSEIDIANITNFIARAAISEATKKAFVRSTKPKGICPKHNRELLLKSLTPHKPVIHGFINRKPNNKVEFLDLHDISGAIGEFPEVIDRLGKLDANANEINIKLNDFTYAATLAVLSQWILANSFVGKYDFIDTSEEMTRYISNIRFDSALNNPEIVISPDPMDWAVGLTRINRDQPTHKVTDKIVDILDTFINPKKEDHEALSVLISEMIENVHRHARTNVDGFAVAQVYPKRLKMGITLVDFGIGIKNSFLEGSPSIDISSFKEDEDYLKEAIKLYSTSKNVGHSGYGLYLLAELIARNRGTFLLTSGESSLIGYQRKGELAYDTYKHASWPGTIVSVIIDLSQRLPLSDIYNEMPLPDGMTEDDLFI